MKTAIILAAILINSATQSAAFGFSPSPLSLAHQRTTQLALKNNYHSTQLQSTTNNNNNDTESISKAPTLNGKMVLPLKPMQTGLKGHKVAAVYALLNPNYKRGQEGWEHVTQVGITKDLYSVLDDEEVIAKYDVKYVRALSFTYPQKATMEDFANGWRMKVREAIMIQSDNNNNNNNNNVDGNSDEVLTLVGGGEIATIEREEISSTVITVGDEYEFDEDDEDMDEDDLDDYLQMMAESRAAVSSSPAATAPLFVDTTSSSSIDAAATSEDDAAIISPFENDDKATATTTSSSIDEQQPLELTRENVDKVLDEVRPYLISDGGNVSVHNVDTETGNVYLVLEGACGSCASSTVTMQMGIERVLKEKFEDKLGEVIQVDTEEEGAEGGKPTELTIEAVQAEVKRMSQAITAMGGVVRVLSVDPIGVVEVEFRGPNKVRKGLELALLDVEFVKHVKFVS